MEKKKQCLLEIKDNLTHELKKKKNWGHLHKIKRIGIPWLGSGSEVPLWIEEYEWLIASSEGIRSF